MEFLNEEKITELNLTEEQLKGLTPLYQNHIAEQKKAWDGKANENAENILSGAASKIYEGTKIERKEGEKIADYIIRVNKESFSAKELEIQQKLKDASKNDSLVTEYETLKEKYSQIQQKEASYDELLKSGIKDKYDELLQANDNLTLNVSFNSIKPNFPDTVNQYEAKAKWEDFKKEVLANYNVKVVDNEAIAIDKENEHKVVKLKDLLSSNKEITALLEGRQQKGINDKPVKVGKVDGVPFDVPETAKTDNKARAEVIREYLAKKGVSNVSPEYSKLFAEYNSKIIKQQTA